MLLTTGPGNIGPVISHQHSSSGLIATAGTNDLSVNLSFYNTDTDSCILHCYAASQRRTHTGL